MSTSFMPEQIQHDSLKRHMLRFSITSCLILVLAVSVEWSMSFVTALFVAQFLLPGKPPLRLKMVKVLALAVLSCFVAGLAIVLVAQPYPILLMIIIAWCLFYVFYRANTGLNELVVLFLLVAIIALPLLASISRAVALGFVVDFMLAFVFALLIVALVQYLVPVDDSFASKTPAAPVSVVGTDVAIRKALVSTMVVFPLVVYFFAFDKLTDLLVVIFVAILAQHPELSKGAKASVGIVFTNILGGLIAIAVFNLLVAVPHMLFLTLLVLLSFMLLAQAIYLHPKGAIVAAGLSAYLVILGSTIGSDGGLANEKFVGRIVQLSMVGLYIVGSFYLVHKLDVFKLSKRG
ncbi:DUF2955 domain-containing protein [Agarivorans sp. TSD2052]|uniref:DUF2955 domain-containing protein n=1 Tax=Agarivorans sp. TSD2052 TaxID=2937286 RepID=UPI00200D652F|nr:DUF2955 domain-containing protein [Agarivorans sp. TSD2052]UPW17875.1 DUF2955 domain-containing protein [Agarivorans sp. TSD2052]